MNEKQTDKKKDKPINLIDAATAVRMVKDAIDREREKLQKIANGVDQSPIMVEGETSEGYYCQLMVDPKDAARIMLKYDYPVWTILMEDAPDEMWKEFSRFYGLGNVHSVEL